MTHEAILDIIKRHTMDILPDVTAEQIDIRGRLKDLGANSIDRMEIVTQTLEDLELIVPLVELAGVDDLQGLVNLLNEKVNACIS